MVVIAGILVCIVAWRSMAQPAMKREKAAQAAAPAGTQKRNTLAGVIICVLAGLLSSGLQHCFPHRRNPRQN